jgi:hypothetical protein
VDRHIDNAETQTYGPKLRTNITAAFAGSPAPVRAFLAWLVEQQAAADQRMKDGMAGARGAASELTAATQAKAPAAGDARALLDGLHAHLGAKRALGEWSGDVKLFFPKGKRGIGRTAHDLVAALDTARDGLAKDKLVPDGKKLDARLAAAKKRLAAEMTNADGAVKAARKGLSEQSAEKKAWLAVYRGISLVAEGVLTLEGRPEARRTVVPHLAVGGGTPKAKKGAAQKGDAPAKKGDGAAPT